MYSIRVISVDSYQSAPIAEIDPTFSQFRGSDIKQVPILRIFGITLSGEKVCLHIHGTFPYMFVPYSGQIKADILAYRLATSIDAAINVSLGSAKANTQHVYKIQQVSGIPFYGYHRKRHHFFKIYYYNPAMMKRAADLLQSGCILDQTFQPHEAHIPFTLQFMIDYNIYGMSMIKLKHVKYRRSSKFAQTETNLSCNSDEILNLNSVEKEYLPYTVVSQSVCELEIDAWASDIVNREVIDKGIELNPGIAAIWEEEKARRSQAGLGGDSQLKVPNSPERPQISQKLTDDDVYQYTRLVQRLSVIESQSDESLLSSSLQNSSYPIRVPDNSNLLDASQLEIHAGPLENSILQKSQNQFSEDVMNQSTGLLLQSQSCLNDISLNSSDLHIAEMLSNLANEQEDIPSSVDSNSILGSQKSQQIQQEFIAEQDNITDNEEEEEEVPDLNLTSLQLDSLNLSSWETYKQKSQNSVNDNSQIELVLESLNNPAATNSSEDIPQLDGPIDDENARMSSSNEDSDVTIERQEFLICEYKSGRCLSTPQKRKRRSSCEDDDSCGSAKKKIKECLPKTPRRSPSKRLSKLTSPSCPSRSYSPLSVEIKSAQKTPKNSPCASPSSRPFEKQRLRENFSRKRIFSPVKESNLEDNAVSPTNAETINRPTKVGLFHLEEDAPDSDNTLVEDSDDSLRTLVCSPDRNSIIINESDSNDTTSTILSKLSSRKLSHGTLETLVEEESAPESKIDEWKEKSLGQRSCSVLPKNTDELIMITPQFLPPSREHIENIIESCQINEDNNIQPFFSVQEDADEQHNQAIGALYRARGRALTNLRKFQGSEALNKHLASSQTVTIEPLKRPPDRESAEAWLKAQKVREKENRKKELNAEAPDKDSQKSDKLDTSSLEDPFLNFSRTLKDVGSGSDASKHFGISCGQIEFNTGSSVGNVACENLGNVKPLTTYQFLTILCLEVHIITRPNLLPDPRYDNIAAVFYAIYNDVPPDWNKTKPLICGAIIVDADKINSELTSSKSHAGQQQSLEYVGNEEALVESVILLIKHHDPEFLIGWDIEFLSWGYLFQRASILGKNLSGKISRIPSAKCNWETVSHDQPSTELQLETLSEVKMPGRIVLDIWRIMRHELALTSYTYENVMFNVMNERIPQPSFDTLSNWWKSLLYQWRVIDHYSNRVIGVHRLLHHLDIINRTSEHARLYGIQFYEVFSRGSQFRVESMMLRLAKPLNYIPVSPSAHQRGCMRAPESLPLIMEPESTMYCDPVVVLDFQSLYPSIIIAYNYCFSTCLGRIEHIGSPHPFEFGATMLKVEKNLALKLQKKMNFAPCGVAFVKKEVRQGILPRMLTEILETRLMVKKAIKDHSKEDRALQRALDSRQLGLKLIANVTYGYTAANFSGRMPCIEVGDSVVSKGKETLERAIKIVESTPKWGARVVYGDTDSLFVLIKGKSREEAFAIGMEIADTVTAANPKPVKLKFEKVLHPCILQTKKRYCGYMYENLNDKPVYLAKGIETVRRDGCPAVAKILEKALRILFESKDLSKVKQYVTRQLDKVLTGRASIQDLTFAKEFRGMKGYKAAACVPALELTRRLIQKDPRAIPRTGSRVPYIIVAGGPNEPLIRCVRAPMELILDPSLRPNAIYYITKVIIPPLNRCLNLIGVDANIWFMHMPHRQALNRLHGTALLNSNRKQKTTISQYLCNATCPSCGQSCDKGICTECIKNQSQTLVTLHEKCRQHDRIYSNIKMICESCIGVMDADSCISLDCPMFYRRIQAYRENLQNSHLYDLIQCMEHLT